MVLKYRINETLVELKQEDTCIKIGRVHEIVERIQTSFSSRNRSDGPDFGQ